MSQSDYITYKKSSRMLRDPTKLAPVLSPSEYTSFKEYALETAIVNSKPTYNQLVPAGKQNVFGMERTTTNCPTFALCTDTNARPNRKQLDAGQSSCFPVMKAPGRTVPTYDKKPTFSTYVRKNYRVKCECNDTTCTGSRSRACRMKYNCTC